MDVAEMSESREAPARTGNPERVRFCCLTVIAGYTMRFLRDRLPIVAGSQRASRDVMGRQTR
eukprot:4906603-Prymnesium_polylepis.1